MNQRVGYNLFIFVFVVITEDNFCNTVKQNNCQVGEPSGLQDTFFSAASVELVLQFDAKQSAPVSFGFLKRNRNHEFLQATLSL